MGVQEAVQHGLLTPYEVVHTEKGSIVAEFFFTSEFPPVSIERVTFESGIMSRSRAIEWVADVNES